MANHTLKSLISLILNINLKNVLRAVYVAHGLNIYLPCSNPWVKSPALHIKLYSLKQNNEKFKTRVSHVGRPCLEKQNKKTLRNKTAANLSSTGLEKKNF
jgi:hypothetical protein